MKYEKVTIKQIPEDNQSATNLKNYKRSRFPSCMDYYQAALLRDGRHITGLDPEGIDLKAIKDVDIREQEAEDRKELFEKLRNINS